MGFSPTERFRPLRRVEYDKLIELGAFQDEKIELLEGVLVRMSPIGPPHSSAVQKLNAILTPTLAARAAVRIQSPFAALDLSEPEPDVAVVPAGSYDQAHPDKAYLIIEVADSSLTVDRGVKQRLYAMCGVPEYWIVNLIDRVLEVHTELSGGGYASIERYHAGQAVHPIHFPDVEVRVTDVFT
ncbi:MAG TPA: Uma2 family endonuclease [Polyangiaceae bacterium]